MTFPIFTLSFSFQSLPSTGSDSPYSTGFRLSPSHFSLSLRISSVRAQSPLFGGARTTHGRTDGRGRWRRFQAPPDAVGGGCGAGTGDGWIGCGYRLDRLQSSKSPLVSSVCVFCSVLSRERHGYGMTTTKTIERKEEGQKSHQPSCLRKNVQRDRRTKLGID